MYKRIISAMLIFMSVGFMATAQSGNMQIKHTIQVELVTW